MTLDRVLSTSRHDLRLVIPALVAFGTCFLSVRWSPPFWSGMVVVLLGLGLAVWNRAESFRSAERLLAAVLVAGVMMLAVSLGNVARNQPDIGDIEGKEALLSIRLEKTSLPGNTSHVGRIEARDGVALEQGPVTARLAGPLCSARCAAGTLLEVTGYVTRGAPQDSAGWVVVVREPAKVIQAPAPLLQAADALRARFLALSAERPGDAGGLLPGLAIGDTSLLNPGLEHAMQTTSLSHLVAVSGANCAIVVGLVVGMVRLMRGGQWVRVTAGLAALAGFVILVTPEPSILRAALMASIVLVSLALERPIRGIPALSATVLALLALDPWLSTSFAFVLSVAATAGILCVTGPLSRMLSTVLPAPLALGVALPLAAQLACMPVLILLSPAIATWGVLANALAAPAAPIATVVGMVACVMTPLLPWVAEVLIAIASVPAAYIAAIGRVLSEWPGASLPWPSGWFGALCLGIACYAVLAWLMLTPPRSQTANKIIGGLLLAAMSAVVAGFGVPAVLTRSSVPEQWTIAQCDVGQGDAVVLRSKNRHLLIDTGSSEDALVRCLGLLGIKQVDVAVITHFDKDHVGAWGALVPFKPHIWVGITPDERKEEFVKDFTVAGLTVREVQAGDSISFGEYHIKVVWPTLSPLVEEGNDSSIVLHVSASESCTSCLEGLFLGDLGERAQRILAGRMPPVSVDLVKVSHHGSPDQYEELYEEIQARIALIGVGSSNPYGHPTVSLVQRLQERSQVVRTDRSGTSTLHKSDSGDIVVWSEHSDPER